MPNINLKISVILISILIYSIKCYSQNEAKTHKVNKLGIFIQVPLFNYDTTLGNNGYISHSDSFNIISYKNLLIYEIPAISIHENSDTIRYDTAYNSFAFKKEDTIIRKYKNLKDSIYTKLSISYLIKRLGALRSYELSPSITNAQLVSITSDGRFDSIATYIPNLVDPTFYDTAYFYFSKSVTTSAYSLSPNLDSISNLKLVQVRLLFLERYSPEYKRILPQNEYRFSITPLEVTNPEEIISFCTKIEK